MIKFWTTFEGKPYGTKKDEARITLSPRKIFLLNQAAYKALGTPEAIEFLFDENRKLIGLKPTDPAKRNAFPLKIKKGSNHRLITAGAFCNHVGIDVEKTVVFNDTQVGTDGIMVLRLDKTINISRGAR